MSRSRRTKGAALVVALTAGLGLAPSAHAASSVAASRGAWDRVPEASLASGTARRVTPKHFAAFRLDTRALGRTLAAAPGQRGAGPSLTLSVPTPQGGFERFAVRETSVLEAGLAAARPDLRTYAGRSLDHPGAEGHFELTPLGFTGAVRGGAEDPYYVDPLTPGDPTDHVAYRRADLTTSRVQDGFVEAEPAPQATTRSRAVAATRAAGAPVTLWTYRLALISDPSYAAHDGANGDTTAAKTVLVDRLNQPYEDDLAIHLVLIDATPKLNLDTAAQATGANGPCGATPCYTASELSSCTDAALAANDRTVGLLAGARNYDVGHLVLGNQGGGVAGLGVAGTSRKQEGCTGVPRPVGDLFAVDYVAHELGHEFGGDHTFGGVQSNCGPGNSSLADAVEPGSGSSIMAYAGICDQDDLQRHSDPYFSQRSIDQITAAAQRAETTTTSVQRAAFTNLGTDSYTVSYTSTAGTTTTSTATLSASSTARQIQTVVNGVLTAAGAGGSVTISAPSAAGWTATFTGGLAGREPGLLGVGGFTGAGTGFVGETVAGGPTRMGGTPTTTANHAPVVTTAPAYTIPVRTPFELTATGTDADAGTALSYLWEQDDTPPATATTGTGLTDNGKTAGALFRVFGTAARYPDANALAFSSAGENQAPSTPVRDFPDVAQVEADDTNAATGSCPEVVQNTYDPTTGGLVTAGGTVTDAVADCYSEFLPTAAYHGDGTGAMHFRVTARDGAAGMGGTAHADTTLTLAPAAGPFRMTAPATDLTVGTGTPLPVSWDPAGTCLAPVGTADVRISLSTDGGASFPYVLAAQTPNDGAATVTLPAGVTTQHGRIRLDAVGNVFFDASRANLAIVDGGHASTGATGAASATSSTGGACAAPAPAADPAPAAGGQTAPQPGPAPASTAPAGDRAPAGPAGSTGMTTTPAPAPPAADARALVLAGKALGGTPAFLGRVGRLRLYATSGSRALGRPRASRRLFVAVCTDAPCAATASAVLRTTNRRGRRVTRRGLRLGALRLQAGTAGSVVLRLTRGQRAAIRGAASATLAVTVADGTRVLSRSYRLTVG